jgi:hypothetical protein
MSQSDIEQLKKYIDEKFGEIKPQVTEMYEAYNTVRQGSLWIKYLFWLAGTLIAAFLAIREFFKH